MNVKLVSIENLTSVPALRDLTPEEEASLIAQYKSTRNLEDLEADYADFDRQLAEAVPAEVLLRELTDDL